MNPFCAPTWAIPAPINPAPNTVKRFTSRGEAEPVEVGSDDMLRVPMGAVRARVVAIGLDSVDVEALSERRGSIVVERGLAV